MTSEEHIRASIDSQISFNSRKNLYYKGTEGGLAFNGMSRAIIAGGKELRRIVAEKKEEPLIDYTVRRALREFYRANQYIAPTADHIEQLRVVYRLLLADVIAGALGADAIARRHYDRLAGWLSQTDPMAPLTSGTERPTIDYVVCAEYSAALQLNILGIDMGRLREPVMDVGCGEHAHLVGYLRANGVEAYGIDRICEAESPVLFRRNWFAFDFRPGSWGTLISNLSFSSHFLNNHLRADGSHAGYARKYMELLNALMPGGSYHYAPSIEFIEDYLPADRYQVRRERFGREHSRTIVTRIG